MNSTSESREHLVRLLGFAPFDNTYGDWERLERDFFYRAHYFLIFKYNDPFCKEMKDLLANRISGTYPLNQDKLADIINALHNALEPIKAKSEAPNMSQPALVPNFSAGEILIRAEYIVPNMPRKNIVLFDYIGRLGYTDGIPFCLQTFRAPIEYPSAIPNLNLLDLLRPYI